MPTGPRISRAVALTAALCLAGCLTPPPPPPSTEPTLVESRLAESGRRIATAWEQIARLQASAMPPPPPAPDLSGVPEPLRRPVTWNQTLPVEAAVRELAKRIGYRARVHGLPPTPAITVHVDAQDTPAVKVAESLGGQLAGRGVVRVDPDAATIDLSYAKRR